MIALKRIIRIILSLLWISPFPIFASPIVNVYVWGGEIPQQVVQQFEQRTGIKVNFATYDNNETMFAKLKASKRSDYDVILPSGYYVERMRKLHLLQKLDHSKLSNLKNLDNLFAKNSYDSGNQFSVPLVWGATGIFYNQNWVKNPPKSWNDLWDSRWRDELLLLDDPREVFSIGLLSLGYSVNDTDPIHIKQAYTRLLALINNIKLFASEGVVPLLVDEEAIAGSAWNGDLFKSQAENKALRFIYPKEGFVIWVDCLAIPANPPHLNEAYQFINYILEPEVAVQIALEQGYSISNAAGRALLPKAIQNDPLAYPSHEVLQYGEFQQDVGETTIALYNQYWEKLKLSF